MREVGFEPTDS